MNLDPGRYEFILAGIDSKKGKSSFKQSFSIVVKRPIWEKWWFILLVVIFSILLIYTLIRYRTYSIQKKNKELVQYAKERNSEVRLRNVELVKAHDELAIKDQHLNSNLSYASLIQNTLQPNVEEIASVFEKNFVLYKPRDVVSGDFYWSTKAGNKRIFIVSDCTGHGVSGAFISVIGITYIRSIINIMGLTKPDEILNQLHHEVSNSLRQETSNIKDGMDVSIICYDENTKELEIACAHGLALVVPDDNEAIQIKSNKFPVGGSSSHYSNRKDFSLNTFIIKERTMLYLFTDGYQDQFGGDDNTKFMKKRFRNLLISNSKKELHTQKGVLEDSLSDWKKDNNQIDDILVVGIELE